MSFTHAEVIDTKIMSGNVLGEEVPLTQLFGQGSMTMTKAHDTPNWVAKFEYDPEKRQIEDPTKVKVK